MTSILEEYLVPTDPVFYTQERPLSPADFTNHTGGAYGADTFGDTIGREFGFTKHMHYRPYDNANLSATLRKKGIKGQHLTRAETDHGRNEINKLLNGRYQDNIVGNLQGRNYYQVANSRAVFCISKIVGMASISGGTNTAFQLAIRMNKPVYVYDVEVFEWYQYNYLTHQLESMGGETPILTKEYAIVGTRDIEDYHIKNKATGQWGSRPNYLGDKTSRIVQEAIRDLYRVTLAAI